MAGRYVVLEFERKSEAEHFISQASQLKFEGAVPVGVFLRPDSYCECPPDRRKRVANWVKGKRTGLYLCTTCRKPSIHHRTGVLKRLEYVFGYNQMED